MAPYLLSIMIVSTRRHGISSSRFTHLQLRDAVGSVLSHCNQLFGTGRMDRDATVKILLGGAHFDCHAKALHHLPATQAEYVHTHDLLLRARTDQFEVGGLLLLLFGGKHIVVHGAKFGLVNADVLLTVLLDGLRLSEPSGAHFWMCEDNAWDAVVLETRGVKLRATEQAVA